MNTIKSGKDEFTSQYFMDIMSFGVPNPWKQRKFIIIIWLAVSCITCTLAFITIPIGTLLSFVGVIIFLQNSGRPQFPETAAKISSIVYNIALISAILNMFSFTIVFLLVYMYMFWNCEAIDLNLCSFYRDTAFVFFAVGILLFVDIGISFSVYVSMRDCQKDIIREQQILLEVELEADRLFREKLERIKKRNKKKNKLRQIMHSKKSEITAVDSPGTSGENPLEDL